MPDRLITHMIGYAWNTPRDMAPGQMFRLKGLRGLECLLRHLEDELFEMTIPELQENMGEYFAQMTRRGGEPLRLYVGRAKRMHGMLQRSIAKKMRGHIRKPRH